MRQVLKCLGQITGCLEQIIPCLGHVSECLMQKQTAKNQKKELFLKFIATVFLRQFGREQFGFAFDRSAENPFLNFQQASNGCHQNKILFCGILKYQMQSRPRLAGGSICIFPKPIFAKRKKISTYLQGVLFFPPNLSATNLLNLAAI